MKTRKILSCILSLILALALCVPALAANNKKGDVNGDGAVTAADARLALRAAVGLETFTMRQLLAAAVSGRRTVTAAESRLILRSAVGLNDPEADAAAAVEAKLSAMSTEEKIEQMIMPALRYFDGAGVETLNSAQQALLARHGFAGVILFAQNTVSAEQTARLTHAMQQANAQGKNRTQLLIAADQEGGKITRLATGTQTPGNMALGAIGDEAAAKEASRIIGSELNSIGINTDFAPVLDVNNNPANPVIGVRSFSDDPALAAKMGGAYITGLQDCGVIAALKHFPGHGDTGTDSHTGLPRIEKTYAELQNRELIPFAAGVAEGAEMIMTAHIQYPKLEPATYISKKTGTAIELPATLSKKIITDVLRGDLGFEGVVITDAMNMDAISSHFDPYDAAVLAINAGVDILLMPVDPSSDAGIAAMDAYIAQLAALTKQGAISEANVNAAVRRILKLKYEKGLFAPYGETAIDAAVAEAKATVGSPAHHEAEWALAKRAVTLVKNDGNLLPLKTENKRILLLAAYPNEVLSMRYGAERLKAEGGLPASAAVTTDCYTSTSLDVILAEVKQADYVIAVSELYRQSALNPNTDTGATNAKLDSIIRAAHQAGGKFVLVSANLPYDTARFQAADAILVCWSDKGMSEDPRVQGGDITQYGPNIPAAVYLALCQTQSPQGKLPVNIPKLDLYYNYSSEILYPFGFGLSYTLP